MPVKKKKKTKNAKNTSKNTKISKRVANKAVIKRTLKKTDKKLKEKKINKSQIAAPADNHPKKVPDIFDKFGNLDIDKLKNIENNYQVNIEENITSLNVADYYEVVENSLDASVTKNNLEKSAKIKVKPQKNSAKIKTETHDFKYPKLDERQKKLNDVGNLTLLKIISWPITKTFGSFYWTIKLKILDKKKVKFEKEIKSKNNEVEDIFAPPPYFEFGIFEIPRKWHQYLFGFIALSVLLIFPVQLIVYYQSVNNVKENILEQARSAFAAIKTGQQFAYSMELESAAKHFELAEKKFILARTEYENMDNFSKNLLNIIPYSRRKFLASVEMLNTGETIAQLGKNLSKTANIIYLGEKNDSWQSEFFNGLALIKDNIDRALPKIAYAQELIEGNNFNELINENKDFSEAYRFLPLLNDYLQNFSIVSNSLLDSFGYNGWRRYLLLFKNNNELRATGGFMGSYALLDIEDGKVVNLEIPGGGTYDLQGSLLPLIESPKPLHLINPIWQFHDSNWWPDFPTSAKKIIWFFENSKNPSVDGVIAITSSFMEELLKITGSVEMAEYNRIISSENFTEETQKIVEIEYDKEENQPKKFIADLAPKIFERISEFNQQQNIDFLSAMAKGLKEKHILLYSTDEKTQKVISEIGWDGSMEQTENTDYLLVVNTNLAGGKTDQVIKQTINLLTEIKNDKIINTLKITKEHSGEKENIFSGVQNNSYMRIYVPQHSKLIDANGFGCPDADFFKTPPPEYGVDEDLKKIESRHLIDEESGTEIYTESGKTVFANWLMIKPGETKEVIVKYELPYTLSQLNDIYALVLQKQAGTLNDRFIQEIVLDSKYSIIKTLPETQHFTINVEEDFNYINLTADLLVDKFFGIKIKK